MAKRRTPKGNVLPPQARGKVHGFTHRPEDFPADKIKPELRHYYGTPLWQPEAELEAERGS